MTLGLHDPRRPKPRRSWCEPSTEKCRAGLRGSAPSRATRLPPVELVNPAGDTPHASDALPPPRRYETGCPVLRAPESSGGPGDRSDRERPSTASRAGSCSTAMARMKRRGPAKEPECARPHTGSVEMRRPSISRKGRRVAEPGDAGAPTPDEAPTPEADCPPVARRWRALDPGLRRQVFAIVDHACPGFIGEKPDRILESAVPKVREDNHALASKPVATAPKPAEKQRFTADAAKS